MQYATNKIEPGFKQLVTKLKLDYPLNIQVGELTNNQKKKKKKKKKKEFIKLFGRILHIRSILQSYVDEFKSDKWILSEREL